MRYAKMFFILLVLLPTSTLAKDSLVMQKLRPEVNATASFGFSLDVDGDYAIIGAPDHAYDLNEAHKQKGAGAAFLYKFDDSKWSLLTKIVPKDRTVNDAFGYSVCIKNNLILVGAPGESRFGPSLSPTGAAYVFKIINDEVVPIQKLTASDAYQYENFGHSVAICADLLLISKNNTVYTYFPASSFYIESKQKIQGSKIVANDSIVITESYAATVEQDSVYAVNSGKVRVYMLENGGLRFNQEITIKEPRSNDYFGEDIDLMNNRLLITTHRKNTIGQNHSYGSVYLYYLDSSQKFVLTQGVCPPENEYNQNDFYGKASGFWGDYLVVGAMVDTDTINGINARSSGAIFLYKQINQKYWLLSKIKTNEYLQHHYFGARISSSSKHCFVSANRRNLHMSIPVMDEGGAVYVLSHVRVDQPELTFTPFQDVFFYPNPTTNFMFHKSYLGAFPTNLMVCDLTGSQIYNHQIQGIKSKLELASGLYYITIVYPNNYQVCQKLVVAKSF